jgi:hypothetical protein
VEARETGGLFVGFGEAALGNGSENDGVETDSDAEGSNDAMGCTFSAEGKESGLGDAGAWAIWVAAMGERLHSWRTEPVLDRSAS